MSRDYQYNYSAQQRSVFDQKSREHKAMTMAAVLRDFLQFPLLDLTMLDVGASTGIIDQELAKHFGRVTGIDIDAPAIDFAKKNWRADNLSFMVGDALHLEFAAESFDAVICAHVYEHVPDAKKMFAEIHRVLKPGGICYFAAGNRLMFNEPHHNLPLLSLLPRQLGHLYVRLAGKGTHYHEQHLSYWGLRKLVKDFAITDYTLKIAGAPEQYKAEYVIRPGSWKQRLALLVLRWMPWACPGYIWVLKKSNR